VSLALPITRYWNGAPCADASLHACVTLSRTARGLAITAEAAHQRTPIIPDADAGCRVANLWEYDVVECFLVGADVYLEVELGAGGHFLLLDFTAPRVGRREYADLAPELRYHRDSEGWRATILLPPELVPAGLHAANAFVCAGGDHLAWAPLPGNLPDFHQPAAYPAVSITENP